MKVKMKTLFYVFCQSSNIKCPYEVAKFETYEEAEKYVEEQNGSPICACMDSSFQVLELEVATDYQYTKEDNIEICFSLNGTLSEKEEYFNIDTEPDLEMLNLVSKLNDKDNVTVLICTSVNETFLMAEKWLDKHNVKYHNIFYKRPRADVYVDSSHLMYNKKKVINKINHDILRPSETFNKRTNKHT